MICPRCKELRLKSKVYDHGGRKTLMSHSPYYDEEGKYHSHDPNTVTYDYACSKGHRFTHSYRGDCPQGDYGTETKVTIL